MWQSFLPSGVAIDQRPQQRKVIGEVFQHAFEVPFQPHRARPRFIVARIAPGGELTGDHFLHAPCGTRGTSRPARRSG